MKNTTASEKIFQKAIADKAMVFCFERVGRVSRALRARRLSTRSKGWSIQKTPTRMSGRDYKGWVGAGARGILPPLP